MTTKENVRKKTIELLDDIRPMLEAKLDKLLDSGVIDFEKEADNYGLPKDIVQALSKELLFQYRRLYPTRRDTMRINKFYKIM